MGRKKRKKVNALETGKHAGPVAAGRALARLGVGMPGFVPGAVQSAVADFTSCNPLSNSVEGGGGGLAHFADEETNLGLLNSLPEVGRSPHSKLPPLTSLETRGRPFILSPTFLHLKSEEGDPGPRRPLMLRLGAGPGLHWRGRREVQTAGKENSRGEKERRRGAALPAPHLRLPRQRLPRVEVALLRLAEGVAALAVVSEGLEI
jgi:hypothetical protein